MNKVNKIVLGVFFLCLAFLLSCTIENEPIACGTDYYDQATQFCSDDKIYDKCNGKIYVPAIQKCDGSILQSTCNDIIYDIHSQSCINGNIKEKDFFIDFRDGKEYKAVVIGTQTWMAENLNYKIDGSKCYGEGGRMIDIECGGHGHDKECLISLSDAEIQANCTKYGRLYDWEAAIDACPEGWHLPTNYEWNTLRNYVGEDTGKKLKARSGDWRIDNNYSTYGTDEYGFSALPSGALYYIGEISEFSLVGDLGAWWTASGNVYHYEITSYSDDMGTSQKIGTEMPLLSVRCIKNYPIEANTKF